MVIPIKVTESHYSLSFIIQESATHSHNPHLLAPSFRLPEATTTGWSLMAAVRSFLHFSQLSAWLSVSGGRRPPNVLYRLTVTSPVFCSKFTAEAEEHVFPITYMGQDTSIKVSLQLSFLVFFYLLSTLIEY